MFLLLKFQYIIRINEEINIQAEKIKLLDCWDLYVRSQCNEEGRQKDAMNLIREEFLGRQQIMAGLLSYGLVPKDRKK